MPQKECKRIILEVHPSFHDMVARHAEKYNRTIRDYVLSLLKLEVYKREKALQGKRGN